jgi:TRAP-type C4-dicarboxylate transport system permease small subunit
MAAEQVNRGGAAAPPRPSGIARAAGLLVSGLEVYCAILMVGMAVIVLTGVWYRYIPQRALSWYDEFAEFLLVWLTFYGSVLATQRDAHIGFETLTDALPPPLRRAVAVFAEIVVLLIQAALFYYGLLLAQAAAFDTAVSIRAVRLSWIYSAIPISGALMFLIGLWRLAGVQGPRRS